MFAGQIRCITDGQRLYHRRAMMFARQTNYEFMKIFHKFLWVSLLFFEQGMTDALHFLCLNGGQLAPISAAAGVLAVIFCRICRIDGGLLMVDYEGYVKTQWCSWRAGQGATVHTIAQYAGVSDSTVRRWDDRRDTALPDTVAVIRIALGLGMSPGALADRLAYGLPRPSVMPMPMRW